MKTMTFAFYKGNASLMDKLISLWMRGPYSHCECILKDNGDGTYVIASSKPGVGVRITTSTLPASDWDFLEAPADVNLVYGWFNEHAGAAYDYVGLFTFIAHPILIGQRNKFWCSEACALAAGYVGAQREDPNSLYNTLYNAAQFAGLSVPVLSTPGV